MKTIFKVQDSTTLLQYALGTDPVTLQAGGSAELQILVNVPPASPIILLRQLQISALIDDPPLTDAINLFATAPPDGAASIVSSDETAWQPTQSAGNFTFTPASVAVIQMTTQSLTLSLQGLKIGTTPGTAQLTIKEWAAEDGGTPPSQNQSPSGLQTIEIPKFPSGFEVTSFTAMPVSVPQGGSVTLSWIASNAQQQIFYDDVVLPTPGNTLPVSGSYQAQNLQNNPAIFTLKSTDPTTQLFIENQKTVEVLIPVVPAPVVQGFTATITAWALESSPQQVTVTLSWTTANVTSISIDTIGVFTGPQALSGSTAVTLPVNEVLTFTMTAYGLPGWTGSAVPASASVPVPAVAINACTGSLLPHDAIWSPFPFLWGFILAWDVSNATAISSSPGAVTYGSSSPARLWGQRGDAASGPTWPYTLSTQGFQPKQAQAGSAGGAPLAGVGLRLILWYHVRQWGFAEGPRSLHLCWFAAMQAELMGWDTACVLPIAEANLALEYNNFWPLPFSQEIDSSTFSGQFGPWQIVPGGLGEILNLQLPIVTCSQSEFDGASVSVQLQLNGLFSQSNNPNAAMVLQIQPAAGTTIGEFQRAIALVALTAWLNANVPTILQILAPMNVLGTASACPGWLQPQTISYSWWQDQYDSQAGMLVLTSALPQPNLPDQIQPQLISAVLATGHSALLIRADLVR